MTTSVPEAPCQAETSLPGPAETPPPQQPAPPPSGKADSPPVRLRELAAITLSVVAFDLLIYRGEGDAGYAAFFVGVGALLLFATPHVPRWRQTAILGGMLLVLAARMIWLGFGFLNVVGLAVLAAFAMTTIGRRPYVLDVALYTAQSFVAGFPAMIVYGEAFDSRLPLAVPRATWLKVVLPAAAVLGFGTIFILANPDVATAVGERIQRGWDITWDAVSRFTPRFGEVVCWIAVALCVGGLLRPIAKTWLLEPLSRPAPSDDAPLFETPLYSAYRNTLVAVIVLFSIYLVFEFATLWFRTFPEGFYYAGYAHEGAAWLTVALAATTLVLSAIFRGTTMLDPRIERLKRLAWGWSALNLLLALAVYNRMWIYVDFNGMTRMRTVGLMGISAVVVGFVLVVWKIRKNRDFAWLIERQLWTLALAIFTLAVLPVDLLVHSYNARRVLAGDLAPAVQITVHPIDSSGVLALTKLAHADDPIIRDGIQSLLAARAAQLETTLASRDATGWTSYQLADQMLSAHLHRHRSDWQRFAQPEQQAEAWTRFRDYAYQWY